MTELYLIFLVFSKFLKKSLGALLISFLERSSQILDLNDIPKEIERIMQGIVILVVVVSYEVVRRYILTQEVKLASRIVDKDE